MKLITLITVSRISPRLFLTQAGPVIGLSLMMVLAITPAPVMAQSSPLEVLERVESLEQAMKDIRRILEEDMRAIKQSLEGNQGNSARDLSTTRNQIEKLSDQITVLSNRMERILGVASDNEFRLLRVEKRVESLMRMGIENSIAQTAPSSPSGIGAGTPPSSSLQSSENQEALWSIDNETLNSELTVREPGSEDTLAASGAEQPLAAVDPLADNVSTTTGLDQPEANPVAEPVEVVSVLPNADADEQYRFALGKALQNDLDMAEQAFDEFISVNPDHSRAADASFWLGRVQFMRGSYEKAAMTFSEFQTSWPNDARVEKTTLWIGEAVTNFATKEEVCELLVSLPSLVPNPTESFFERLDKLKLTAACPE